MKKLSAIFYLLSSLCLLATGTNTVTFSLQQLVGTPLDRTLIIKPLGAPWFVGTNVIYGDPVTNRTTGGQAWTNLYAGPYTVALSGLPSSIIIDVTNSASPQSAAGIARKTPQTNPAIRYYSADEVDALLIALTNGISSGGSGLVNVSSNDATILTFSSNDGSGHTNVYVGVNTAQMATLAAVAATNAAGTNSALAAARAGDLVTSNAIVSIEVTNYTIPATNIIQNYQTDTNNGFVSGNNPSSYFSTFTNFTFVAPGYTNNASGVNRGSLRFNAGGWVDMQRAAGASALTNASGFVGTYSSNNAVAVNVPIYFTFATITNTPTTNAYLAQVIVNGRQKIVGTTNVTPQNDGYIWVATDTNSPGQIFIGNTNQTWQAQARPVSGSTTNAISMGAVGDGTTDNWLVFSNLFAVPNASIRVPGGDFYFTKALTMAPGVRLEGDGPATRFLSGVPSNQWAITTGPNCNIGNFVFDGGIGTNTPISTTGGGIYFNTSNFPSLYNVRFQNTHGWSTFASGDNDYLARLNHWLWDGLVFTNVWSGGLTDTSNKAEYAIIKGLRSQWIYGTGLQVQSANTLVSDCEINGYSGSAGIPVSTGLVMVATYGRGLFSVVNTHSAHHKVGLWVENNTGGSFTGCGFEGDYLMITNSANIFFNSCYLIQPELMAIGGNNTGINFNQCKMLGTNFNSAWTTYSGSGNTLNGTNNPNDNITLGKIVVTGQAQSALTNVALNGATLSGSVNITGPSTNTGGSVVASETVSNATFIASANLNGVDTNSVGSQFGVLYQWSSRLAVTSAVNMTFNSSDNSAGFAVAPSLGTITNLNAGKFLICFEIGQANTAANMVWTIRTNGVSTLRTNSLIVDTVRGGSHSTVLPLPANTAVSVVNESVSATVSVNGELIVRRIQ